MKKLLEAINRGILKGLNENNIELLADLDDDNLDLMDSILTKSVNSKILVKYFPKTKDELVLIIKDEVKKNGWNCDLNHIDTSKIIDMSYLFSSNYYYGYNLEHFNGDISRWNVSNVKNMLCMFCGAKLFNQSIGNWDVSDVTNMSGMFQYAESFNQPIGDWNVSNVTSMTNMFYWAESFNQPIGNWDVSNVKRMDSMFEHTESFNQPIGDWDVSNVTNMYCMFDSAKSFNQDLSKWKLKPSCNTDAMIYNCPIKQEYKPKRI